ncbi:MAG TPA: hypothetical protein VLC51_09410, partial [Nitrospira sp.]|nr:hypothetical protein [Nitrospira sp.]
VLQHTDEEINERISRRIEANVNFYATQDRRTLNIRLQELDREWDIERVLEANAAAVSLIGLGLGRLVSRRWYLLPTAVAGFLLQHAVQGWCPPISLFRRLGVRTTQEIDHERYALKALRGDFSRVQREESPSAEEALHAVHNP